MNSVTIKPLEALNENLILKIKDLIILLSSESYNFPFDANDFSMTKEQLTYFLNILVLQPNSVCFLAEKNNELVGFAYLEGGKRQRTYHLASLGMGVTAKYTSKGIGSRLLYHLLEYAEKGEFIAKIDAIVHVDNIKAINLYKKFGFTCEGRVSRTLFINGDFFDVLLFGKKID